MSSGEHFVQYLPRDFTPVGTACDNFRGYIKPAKRGTAAIERAGTLPRERDPSLSM